MYSLQPGRIDWMKVKGVSFNTFLHFPIYIEKELITPPLNGLILPGVTRKSLLELAKSWVSYSLHKTFLLLFLKIVPAKEAANQNAL